MSLILALCIGSFALGYNTRKFIGIRKAKLRRWDTMSIEHKIEEVRTEIMTLAERAAANTNKRPYEDRAYQIINNLVIGCDYKGPWTRQKLLRLYYSSLNNYLEENNSLPANLKGYHFED